MTGMSLVVDMEHTRDMDITLNIDKVMINITDYCWNYTSLWILRAIPLESIHKTVA
jgi:predicted signal transduction protein with EAL and GGDEF domain